jgi:ABC-2 type transport system ATP-binding protein
MDPKGREEMLVLIADIVRNKGLNVILSSHLLPDVEQTCEHLVVLDKGTVATQGRIAGLKGAGGSLVELRVKGEAAAFFAAMTGAGFQPQDVDDDVLRVFVPAGADPQRIFTLASTHGVQVRHFRASVETLEDVFAKAVGEA